VLSNHSRRRRNRRRLLVVYQATCPGRQPVRKGGVCMARYGKGAQKSVKRAMHKRKKGTLSSGKSGKRVKNRKQAIAIGLSEARRKGAKVPRKKAA
jgi:hypothetical protein